MPILKAQPELLNIDSIQSKISPETNTLRHKIMNTIIETGKPYIPQNKSEEAALAILKEKNTINCPHKVESIYPLSATPTSKKVTLLDSQRVCYAMCAIDAIGMHYTFGEPIHIQSLCEQTQEPISLTITDQTISNQTKNEDIRILYTDLKKSNSWSCCCCVQIHFFKNSESLASYVDQHLPPDQTYYDLSLEEAHTLAKNLFGEK